jgi:hypothetical protein
VTDTERIVDLMALIEVGAQDVEDRLTDALAAVRADERRAIVAFLRTLAAASRTEGPALVAAAALVQISERSS